MYRVMETGGGLTPVEDSYPREGYTYPHVYGRPGCVSQALHAFYSMKDATFYATGSWHMRMSNDSDTTIAPIAKIGNNGKFTSLLQNINDHNRCHALINLLRPMFNYS